MTVQGSTVHQDQNGIKTVFIYTNRGDGVSEWVAVQKAYDGADATQGLKADAAVALETSSGSIVALLKGIISLLRKGTRIRGASGNVANASAVATLAAGGASVMTYITGFNVTAAGATAAANVTVTVAGVTGGTMSYTFTAPAGDTVAAQGLHVNFGEPIPASALNTAIVVTLPALGAGNTHASVTAHGFQR